MDPISIAATVITLGTFIKDLIGLGEGIRSSIEKVGENRRQIRELSQDIVRRLYELAHLTHGKEDVFHGPELLSALENLKAEMLHVHSKCLKTSPVQLPGFRRVGSQFNAWRKRDDLEKKITSLGERVSSCFVQFTAFSAARTEQVAGQLVHSTLRMEQRLVVDHTETLVKVRRLEGMMAQLLLESDFGRHQLGKSIETVSSDPSFRKLDSQFISAQLGSLVNSLEQLMAGGRFTFRLPLSNDKSYRPVFVDQSILTSSHALILILQLIVKIEGTANATMPLELTPRIWSQLTFQLSHIGMTSQAIICGRLNIAFFRYASNADEGTGILPHLAHTLSGLSFFHSRRFELAPALEFSQRSLDLWAQVSDVLPCDNQVGILESMLLHAANLLTNDEKIAALSTAEKAVSIARPMKTGLIEYMSQVPSPPFAGEDKFKAAQCRNAFLVLARILASLDRPLESYDIFKEGWHTACSLPLPLHPPSAENVDAFINVVCQLAEVGHLSLPMLSECVLLFRDLARISETRFSYQFIRLLHALAYVSPQSPPDLSNLRLFLEPASQTPAPGLDITKPIHLDPAILQDAVELFCSVAPEDCTAPLIHNILIAHFDLAIAVLRAFTSFNMFNFPWILSIAHELLPFLTRADHSTLLEVLGQAIKKFCVNSVTMDPMWAYCIGDPLQYICRHALKIGAHDAGLRLCKDIAGCLACQFHTEDGLPVVWSQSFLLFQVFILCDAARFTDAKLQVVQMSNSGLLSFQVRQTYFLQQYIIKARILQRVGRHREALQLMRGAVTSHMKEYRPGDAHLGISRCSLCFLFTQLAVVWGHLGNSRKALENAERAVTAWEEINREHPDEEDIEDPDEEDLVCVEIHLLSTLSNCQAAAGKTREALESAQRAVSLYSRNEAKTWRDSLLILRKQEVGGSAFFSLSLRLATSGDHQQALSNGEKAIALSRELVALAPRHLPTLASNLQHLASIKWDLGRREEAIVACDEAIQILRNVAKSETCLLPTFADALDQHCALLVEQGDASGAAAVTAEAVEARKKFASLPPGPEWLFEKV
ncbi:Tetratricopeptide repeat family, partial [Favolaschia claudopus]